MLLLAALAAVTPPPQRPQALVRILRPVRVTKAEWDKVPAERRREITIRERDSGLTKVRVVDFE